MPLTGIQPGDIPAWLKLIKEQGVSLHVSPESALILAPANRAPSWQELEEDGSPRSTTFIRPEQVDGYHVYVSQPDGPQSSMTRQTLQPFPAEAGQWTGSQPVVRGPRPLKSRDHAAKEPPPRQAIVESVTATRKGFRAGVYPYAQGYVTPDGLRTGPGPSTSVTVLEGQAIRVKNDTEAPDGLRIVHYLGEPNGNDATLKEQRITGSAAEEVVLSGPYRNGRLAPSQNLTYLGKPDKPRYSREIRLRPDARPLLPGVGRFAITYISRYGSGPASLASEYNPLQDLLPDRAFYVFPKRRRGAIRWRVHVYINRTEVTPVADGEDEVTRTVGWYELVGGTRREGGLGGFFFSSRHRPRVNGFVETSPTGVAWFFVQSDPPSEDESGIETPTEQPDPPVAFGAVLPAPAFYWVALSKMINGVETVIGPHKRHQVLTGQMMRVKLPPTTNLLPNAEFSAIDSNGTPVYVTPVARNGLAPVFRDGKAILDTGGAISTQGPYVDFAPVEIIPEQTWTFAGKILAKVTSGAVHAQVLFYNSAGTYFSFIDLVTATIDDYREFATQIGPNSANPWPAGAASFVLRFIIVSGTSTSMNARAEYYDLAVHPFKAAIRKVEPKPAQELADPDNFGPSAETPFPDGAYGAIGPLPGIPATGRVPYATEDFETGSYSAAWTASIPGTATLTVSSASAITGGFGLQAKSNNGQGTATLSQSFPSGSGGSIGFRTSMRLANIPALTAPGTVFTLARIRSVGDVMGFLYFTMSNFGKGQLWLRSLDRLNKREDVLIVDSLSLGDKLDVEVIVSRAGTTEGALTGLVGRNGRERELTGSISAIDYRNRAARTTDLGIIFKGNEVANMAIGFDDVVITERGDYIGEEPVSSTPTPPDAPVGADGTYREAVETADGLVKRNQMYLFLMRASGSVPNTGLQRTSWYAAPGRYTVAIYGRHVVFNERVSEPMIAYAVTPEGKKTEIGRLYPGASGEMPWTDWWATVDVPAGYYEVSLECGAMWGGEYVWQEPLLAPGDLTLHADRDAARDGGRALGPAALVVDMEAGTPGYSYYDGTKEGKELGWYSPPDVASEGDYPEGKNLLTANQSNIEEGTAAGFYQNTATVTASTEDVYEGAYSLRIESTGNGYYYVHTSDSQRPVIPAGQPLSLSGWVKGIAGKIVRISVAHRSMDDFAQVGEKVLDFVADGTWQYFSLSSAYLDTDTMVHIRLGITDGVIGDVHYADKLQLEYGTVPTGWEIGTQGATPPALLKARYQSADTQAGLDSAPAEPEAGLVSERQWARATITLSGDGIATPAVSAASLAWRKEFPTLLRVDRSPLQGGALVEDLTNPYTRPDYDTEPVAGQPRPTAITPELMRLQPFRVLFYSEEGKAEFEDECAKTDWTIEDAYSGDLLRIRLYEPVVAVPLEGVPELRGQRYVKAIAEIDGAYVVERAPLERVS